VNRKLICVSPVSQTPQQSARQGPRSGHDTDSSPGTTERLEVYTAMTVSITFQNSRLCGEALEMSADSCETIQAEIDSPGYSSQAGTSHATPRFRARAAFFSLQRMTVIQNSG
jgi:hypothetical protein